MFEFGESPLQVLEPPRRGLHLACETIAYVQCNASRASGHLSAKMGGRSEVDEGSSEASHLPAFLKGPRPNVSKCQGPDASRATPVMGVQ